MVELPHTLPLLPRWKGRQLEVLAVLVAAEAEPAEVVESRLARELEGAVEVVPAHHSGCISPPEIQGLPERRLDQVEDPEADTEVGMEMEPEVVAVPLPAGLRREVLLCLVVRHHGRSKRTGSFLSTPEEEAVVPPAENQTGHQSRTEEQYTPSRKLSQPALYLGITDRKRMGSELLGWTSRLKTKKCHRTKDI